MKLPLYLQIIAALIVATIVGALLRTGHFDEKLIEHLALPCTLILKALRTLATPLIFLAIIHTFITADIPGKSSRKLFGLLMGRICCTPDYGGLVSRSMSDSDQCHGRYDCQCFNRWEISGATER